MERQLGSGVDTQSDYTTARADTTTERRQEEQNDTNIVFEPDLAFMVNDDPSSIEAAFRRADRNQWIDAINNQLE